MTLPSTVLEGVKTFIKTYEGLTTELVLVNSLNDIPVAFSIVPLPGAKILETYLDDSTLREYPFALQAAFYTADEAQRISNYDFYDGFSLWIETQNNAGTLPTLPTDMTAEKIEITDLPILFEQGESETGVYQITCKLTYNQDAP